MGREADQAKKAEQEGGPKGQVRGRRRYDRKTKAPSPVTPTAPSSR